MPLNPKRVQAVFLEAADYDDLADRAAVLDRECMGDTELRQRVRGVLMAHDRFNDSSIRRSSAQMAGMLRVTQCLPPTMGHHGLMASVRRAREAKCRGGGFMPRS